MGHSSLYNICTYVQENFLLTMVLWTTPLARVLQGPPLILIKLTAYHEFPPRRISNPSRPCWPSDFNSKFFWPTILGASHANYLWFWIWEIWWGPPSKHSPWYPTTQPSPPGGIHWAHEAQKQKCSTDQRSMCVHAFKDWLYTLPWTKQYDGFNN